MRTRRHKTTLGWLPQALVSVALVAGLAAVLVDTASIETRAEVRRPSLSAYYKAPSDPINGQQNDDDSPIFGQLAVHQLHEESFRVYVVTARDNPGLPDAEDLNLSVSGTPPGTTFEITTDLPGQVEGVVMIPDEFHPPGTYYTTYSASDQSGKVFVL